MNFSVFTNAIKLKCPRCRKADLFYYPTLKFKRLFDMKLRCSCCDANFMPEPGFYYGSMFISYLLTSFFMLGTFFILKFAFGMETYAAFGVVLVCVILMYFFIFRFSRSLWLSFFLKYDPDAKCVDN